MDIAGPGRILLVFWGLLAVVLSQDDGPIVSTANGLVEGFSSMDRFNRTYDAFLGLPFAQPPVGDLRWKPAQRPVDSWTGIRNATEFAPHCIQFLTVGYPLIGVGGNDSEDCLYLNVYVPVSVDDALGKNLPVMFFYYGGAYLFGTAEMYPGQELATDQNVIVVTTTYRTSIIGFLSTEDAASPGNYGLWDGKAGLEWVIENIAQFGGNPTDITVFGQSAGAGMTMHSTLSSYTNNLFQKAISISGSATAVTAFTLNALRSAQYMSDVFFCNTTDTYEIVDCLMEKDAKTLDTLGLGFTLFNQSRIPDFVPVIDGDFVHQDTRLSMEQGLDSHIHLITGHTVHDGAGFALSKTLGAPPILEFNFTRRFNRTDGNRNSEDIYDFFILLLNGFTDDPDALYEILLARYPDLNSTDDRLCSIAATEIVTSWWFSCGTHYDASYHSRAGGAGNTFVYRFEHRQSFLTGYPDWVNGSHVDDLYGVFGDPFMKTFREKYLDTVDFSPEDEQVGQNIRDRFGNFAYTGNPNTGPNSPRVVWPDYGGSGEFLIQAIDESLTTLTAEEKAEQTWFYDEWWPLIKPIWQDPVTVKETPTTLDESDRIPFDEEEFLESIDNARLRLYEMVGYDEETMEAIDDRIYEALLDRERYRR